jgi:hypothetical protein
MNQITKSAIEQFTIVLLEKQDYQYFNDFDIKNMKIFQNITKSYFNKIKANQSNIYTIKKFMSWEV